ncbi:MAG: EAL domain-containing protein [Actinobacteria bacterium]|nr:EAL domain-containing protein [Actinomycetota bacterium]
MTESVVTRPSAGPDPAMVDEVVIERLAIELHALDQIGRGRGEHSPRHASARAIVPGYRRLRAAVIAGPLLVALLGCLFYARIGGDTGVLRIDDIAQLTAAALAAITAGCVAVRSTGRRRISWIAIAWAAGCWALGQALWCYYELFAGRLTPFPSLCDLGFLMYPVGAVVGLWTFWPVGRAAARRRWLLDGAIVVTALTAVSWSTSLGAVAHAGGDTPFAFAVSLAYPIGDILTLTMAVATLSRPGPQRRHLFVLSGAMAAMAVADSSFTYLTAMGEYHTGNLSDLGWISSFLLLAFAGLTSLLRPAPVNPPDDPGRGARTTMLPYVPIVVAISVLAVRRYDGYTVDTFERGLVVLAMLLILMRQYSTLRENRALLRAVAAREEQLERQAFCDALTGIANRALFLDRVQHALELHRRDLRPLAILFCDLDDFKTVNDTLGHGIGDEVLLRVAERLTGALRPGDTVARLGGDEFAVLLEDGGEPAIVAARLIDALSAPITTTAGQRLTVRASVGVAELAVAEATPTIENILARADIAMYTAKRRGKGSIACFDPSMALPHVADLRLRQPLVQAVAEGTLDVVYQPIARLCSHKIHGFEALARWTYEGEAVPPDQFIPIAARAGVLEELTDFVLERACAQLAAWTLQHGDDELRIGVNIPPTLMTDPGFPARVRRLLAAHHLGPGRLVLEITEDALLDDPIRAGQVAADLKALGVRLALDDFGKGYSSLVHLQRIPLDSLKIDQSFIVDIDCEPTAERFAGALLALGRDLGLEVVAEGIERPEQLDVLRRLGFTMAQGYLLCRPGAPETLAPYLSGVRPLGGLTAPGTDLVPVSG